MVIEGDISTYPEVAYRTHFSHNGKCRIYKSIIGEEMALDKTSPEFFVHLNSSAAPVLKYKYLTTYNKAIRTHKVSLRFYSKEEFAPLKVEFQSQLDLGAYIYGVPIDAVYEDKEDALFVFELQRHNAIIEYERYIQKLHTKKYNFKKRTDKILQDAKKT